jgi:hypothetical protein
LALTSLNVSADAVEADSASTPAAPRAIFKLVFIFPETLLIVQPIFFVICRSIPVVPARVRIRLTVSVSGAAIDECRAGLAHMAHRRPLCR